MSKKYSVRLIDGVNTLEMKNESQSTFLVGDSILSAVNTNSGSNLVVLVAALWNGVDRLMIERGLEAASEFENIQFGIKRFDRYEELKVVLEEEKTASLFTPFWLFIKDGEVLHKEHGKVYQLDELRKELGNLVAGFKPTPGSN